ncbi:MAG: T9SS type A sorting domain-containing protein [Melioribacteraceae bacterium]|nr:T9SS type A sorting domain-containing protein [Melioribacteraceae bacterium]
MKGLNQTRYYNRTFKFKSLGKILFILLLVALTTDISAEIKTWTGNVSSDWNDKKNWDPNGVPKKNDDVIIANVSTSPILTANTKNLNSVTIEPDAILTVDDKRLNANEITVNGTLDIIDVNSRITSNLITVNGILNQTEGLINSSNIVINSDALFIADGGQLDANEITVDGTLNIIDANSVVYANTIDLAGAINQEAGHVDTYIFNLDGGTYNQTDGSFYVEEFISTSDQSVFNSTGGIVAFVGFRTGSDSDFSMGDIQFHDLGIYYFAVPNFDTSGENVNIGISGDFISYGLINDVNEATFVFNGEGEQNIFTYDSFTGNSSFGNIDVTNSTGPVVLYSDVNVENSFTGDPEILSENGNTLFINGQPLPVELVSFEASIADENVFLNWETATEVNNYGFDVQRSFLPAGTEELESSEEWIKIGFVNGHGNSNSPKEYQFIDETANLSGKYKYRLKQIDVDGKFEYLPIAEVEIDSPETYLLKQNHPNPFNPVTNISFTLPKVSDVKLIVFDILGREVETIVNGTLNPGNHIYKFDASRLSSGVYYYQIQTNQFVETKKMNLLK